MTGQQTTQELPEIDADGKEVFNGENSGINFDAYEDIPVETSGNDVPEAIKTFQDIDLGEAINANVRRCKFRNPTPVQKYSIPIGIAVRRCRLTSG